MSYKPLVVSVPTYTRPNIKNYSITVSYELPASLVVPSVSSNPLEPLFTVSNLTVTEAKPGSIQFNLTNVLATKITGMSFSVVLDESKLVNPEFVLGSAAKTKTLTTTQVSEGNYYIELDGNIDVLDTGAVLTLNFTAAANTAGSTTEIKTSGTSYTPNVGSIILGTDTSGTITFTSQPVDTSVSQVPAYSPTPVILDLSAQTSTALITGLNDFLNDVSGMQTMFLVKNCQVLVNSALDDYVALTLNGNVVGSGQLTQAQDGSLQVLIGSTSSLITINDNDTVSLFLVKKGDVNIPDLMVTLATRNKKPVEVTYGNLNKVNVSIDNDLGEAYIGIQGTVVYKDLPNYLIGQTVSLKINSLIVKTAVVTAGKTATFGTSQATVGLLLTDLLTLVGPEENNLTNQITLQTNQLAQQAPQNIKVDFIDTADNATISSANDFIATKSGIQTFITYSNLQASNIPLQQNTEYLLFADKDALSYAAVQLTGQNLYITFGGTQNKYYALKSGDALKLVKSGVAAKTYTIDYVAPAPVILDIINTALNKPITKENDFDYTKSDIQTYVRMNNIQQTGAVVVDDLSVLTVNDINAKIGLVRQAPDLSLYAVFGNALDVFTLKPGDSLKLSNSPILPVKPVTVANSSSSPLIVDLSTQTPATLSYANDFSGDPGIQTYIIFKKLESKVPAVTTSNTFTLKINDVVHSTVQAEKNALGNYLLTYGSLNSLVTLAVGDALKIVSQTGSTVAALTLRQVSPSPLYVNMSSFADAFAALSVDNDFDPTAQGIQTLVVYYNLDVTKFPVGSTATLLLNNEQIATSTVTQGVSSIIATFGSAESLVTLNVGDVLNIIPFKPINLSTVNPLEIVFDPDGNYTISWSAVSHPLSGTSSVGYRLEESSELSFSQPLIVYAGLETSAIVRGRSNGVYFYRVFATSGNVSSSASNIATVTVGPIQERPQNITLPGNEGGEGSSVIAGDGSGILTEDLPESELQLEAPRIAVSELAGSIEAPTLVPKDVPLKEYISNRADFNFQKLMKYINPDL